MGDQRYFSCLAQALRKNKLLKKDLNKITHDIDLNDKNTQEKSCVKI